MKMLSVARGLVVCALSALPAGSVAVRPAAQVTGGAAEGVERLERRLTAAIAARDMDTYQAIVAEDYVATSPTSEQTRSEIVAAYRSGTLGFPNLHIDDVRVRVYGDTAVLTAFSTYSTNDKGSQGHVRFMRVYARRNGPWRAVAQFNAPAPPPK